MNGTIAAAATPAVLADVAQQTPDSGHVLDRVGMAGIALPLQLDGQQVAAMADLYVDLADPAARGIHMSRLYLQLQHGLQQQAPEPARLRELLEACIASQQGLATSAYLELRFSALFRRPALRSANSGWRSYPVRLSAQHTPAGFVLQLQVGVQYSSTCPASAALSRQVNAEHFLRAFTQASVSRADVAAWLESEPGLAATPHAQRSTAEVEISLSAHSNALPLQALVHALETALATPVQTAVKREDERAFAEANAANLMFCEDAARRVASALDGLTFVDAYHARVAHYESLHAHDAVAVVTGQPATRRKA